MGQEIKIRGKYSIFKQLLSKPPQSMEMKDPNIQEFIGQLSLPLTSGSGHYVITPRDLMAAGVKYALMTGIPSICAQDSGLHSIKSSEFIEQLNKIVPGLN